MVDLPRHYFPLSSRFATCCFTLFCLFLISKSKHFPGDRKKNANSKKALKRIGFRFIVFYKRTSHIAHRT